MKASGQIPLAVGGFLRRLASLGRLNQRIKVVNTLQKKAAHATSGTETQVTLSIHGIRNSLKTRAQAATGLPSKAHHNMRGGQVH